jgi:hypothetical protein
MRSACMHTHMRTHTHRVEYSGEGINYKKIMYRHNVCTDAVICDVTNMFRKLCQDELLSNTETGQR